MTGDDEHEFFCEMDEGYKARKDNKKMTKTITVKGVGNISAKPDYITISMSIFNLF